MAKESNAVKGAAKKPPGEMPTRVDQLAATVGPEEAASEIVEVEGKRVRKDPPVSGSTQPIAQDTLATVAPDDLEQEPAMSAQKPTDAPKSPAAGATMFNNFKLLKKLGQGGMGAVYKAQKVGLENVVAIKVLAKELSSKQSYKDRFMREARVMLALDHPNILRCIDVDEDKAKGLHYIVLEFVDGGSVENWLKKLGKFSVGDALHLILKTAEALQHAHAKSMIHRDVKPDNILLTKSGVVKVADLGLAKDTSEDTSLTKTGAGAGTPIYMAPEQARDVKHVDCRVDIYALGVMMYVFLTGRAPFEGTTLVELIAAKDKGKFDPMRKYNSDVPGKLDLIVDKMLAKDPKHRYASCQEVIDELEPLGLAYESLSFIGGEAPNGAGATANKTQSPGPKAAKTHGPAAPAADTDPPRLQPKAKAGSKTVGPKAAAAHTQMAEDEDAGESAKGVFYWKLVTKEGKSVTKKVTAEQVKTLIKAGHMEPDAQLSKSEKVGFRPAATFTDFHPFFKSRETATQANIKGAKGKNRMQDLIDEDARRRKYGWLGRMFKGFGGFLFGLVWIGLILAIIGGLGYFGWKYMNP